MGLSDLVTGIIRTPLEPTQTFMDDPLRTLRLIRIAGRLGFQIDQSTAQAMKAPVVRTAFNVKITRERVGLEVKKKINGPYPLAAFELLYENDLYSTVFLDRLGYLEQALLHIFPRSGPNIPWPTSWPLAFRNLAFLLQNASRYSKRDFWESEARLHIWLMAAWAPLALLRKTNIEQVMKSATGAIKTTRQTSKILSDCLKNMDFVHATVQQVTTASARVPRGTFGMAIRSWGVSWKLQVLYALLVDAMPYSVNGDAFPNLLHRYSKFMDLVFDQRLENAPLAKPILNGSELKSIFNLTQNGAFLQVDIDGLVQWQFDHENASKADAIEWVLTQKENFHIP